MRVLLISAHPDDELLAMGGTVARHVKQEDTLRPAMLCEGSGMRYHPERHEEVRAWPRPSSAPALR